MSDGEKTLIFNPGGFILKILISAAFAVFYAKVVFPALEAPTFMDYVQHIIYMLMCSLMVYDVCSLFGFALNTTGNFFVAGILFVILLIVIYFGLNKIIVFISSDNEIRNRTVGLIADIVLSVLYVIPFARDVKKAVLYCKYTV